MYIRTKDGVYEVDENSKGNEDFLWVKTNESNIVQLVWLNCILNQSENLEELCDRFVVMDKETKEVISIVSFWNTLNFGQLVNIISMVQYGLTKV